MYDYMGEGGRGGRGRRGIKGKGSCGETKADLEGFHVQCMQVYTYIWLEIHIGQMYIFVHTFSRYS